MSRLFPGLACGLMLLCGCGLRRHAAEAAAVQLNARYDSLESRVERLQPALAQRWRLRLTQLDRELAHGDPAQALAHAAALQDSLTRLEGDLDEMESELEEQWSALAGTTPALLERLARDPDPHVRREAERLEKAWRAALASRETGRALEAVERARAVHTKAIPLSAGTH